MRLLLITSSFHPVIGGAETYAWAVSSLLTAAGHQVAVATDWLRGSSDLNSGDGDPAGVAVHRLDDYRRLLADPSKIHWEQMAFGLHPGIAEVAERFRPDVVLTNSLDTTALGKTVALERNVPWVATFHEQAPEVEPLGRARMDLAYRVLAPDLVLAGSEFYAERARRYGAPCRVVHHGVDTGLFSPERDGGPARRRYGVDDEEILLVCAGRLKARKGVRETVEAVAALGRRHPNIRLVVAGSVSSASLEYASDLEDRIDRHELRQRVVIDQRVSYGQMPELLAAADIVVQPSLEEGLGLAVLEGMSSARPVITTDIPGVREIVTRDDVAVSVPPADVRSLTEAIDALVTHRDRRESLGRRGRKHVEEHFSTDAMTRTTVAALNTVLPRFDEHAQVR